MNVSPAVAEELPLDEVREGAVVASSVCSPTRERDEAVGSVRWRARSSQMGAPVRRSHSSTARSRRARFAALKRNA